MPFRFSARGVGVSLSFLSPCFSNEREKQPSQKTRREKLFISLPRFSLSDFLLSSPTTLEMDGPAAPGPSGGSAPRLRVDELLDDVANSVRRGKKNCANAFRRRHLSWSASLLSLSMLPCLSLFDSKCSPDREAAPLSAARELRKRNNAGAAAAASRLKKDVDVVRR